MKVKVLHSFDVLYVSNYRILQYSFPEDQNPQHQCWGNIEFPIHYRFPNTQSERNPIHKPKHHLFGIPCNTTLPTTFIS